MYSEWETHSMMKLVSSLLSWKILSFSKGGIIKLARWGPRKKCKQLLNFHVCSWSWLDIVCGRGGGFDLPNKGSFGGRFFGFWTIFSVFSGNRKWSRDQGRRTKRPLNSSQIILKKLGNSKVNDRQKFGVDPLFIKKWPKSTSVSKVQKSRKRGGIQRT